MTPQELLDFWFSERVRPLRFRSTPEFDREVTDRYLSLWQQGRDGQLDDWRETADGALALVILLDQFPLHMFRGEAASFSTEALARDVAAAEIDRGFDDGMEAERLAFLYMPFMHSERLADQDRSVALFEAAGLTDNLRWARHHRDIVRRFGRFPHRNRPLGRESTPEERDYLDSKEAFHG